MNGITTESEDSTPHTAIRIWTGYSPTAHPSRSFGHLSASKSSRALPQLSLGRDHSEDLSIS